MDSSQLHKPVLLNEVLTAFKEHFLEDQSFFGIDGTFGRGGHFKALVDNFKNLEVLGLDQDQEALDFAKENYQTELRDKKLQLLHTNFSDTEKIKSNLKNKLDFVFLDIGVSSPQLDNPERGFSFYKDGPLDMRMDKASGLTAQEVVNTYSLEELREIFLEFGEVYAPQKLLNAISEFRNEKQFESTLELANLIEKTCGWRKKGMHPATLYFQALRLYVNKELESLKKALDFYLEELSPGGVFMVISFHSLEDRIVKKVFRSSTLGKPVNKKVIKPSREEELSNPRARSAKLRVFKKGEA